MTTSGIILCILLTASCAVMTTLYILARLLIYEQEAMINDLFDKEEELAAENADLKEHIAKRN